MVRGLIGDAELWAHQTLFLDDIAECRVATVSDAATLEDMAAALLRQSPLYD